MANTNVEVGSYLDPNSSIVSPYGIDLFFSDEDGVLTPFSIGRTAVPLTNGETAIVNEDGIVEEIR